MGSRSFQLASRQASVWVAFVMMAAAGISIAQRSTVLMSLAGPAVLGVMLVQLGDYGKRGAWLPNAFTFARVLVTAWLARIGSQLTGPSLATALLLVFLMDGLDGFVARTTHTDSAQGAHFDLECDAFVLLIVCVLHTLRGDSAWVLLAGLSRYAYAIAVDMFELRSKGLHGREARYVSALSLFGLSVAFIPSRFSGLLVALSTLALFALFGRMLHMGVRHAARQSRAAKQTRALNAARAARAAR
jgi:phosphatidylglycerophosphate synthase